jgi:Tol biopolymer transport system component
MHPKPFRLAIRALLICASIVAAADQVQAADRTAPTQILIATASSASPLAPTYSALWLTDLSGHLRRILNWNEGTVDSPALSPSGAQIAYVVDGQALWLADRDGSHPHLLYTLAMDGYERISGVRYTPDGRTLGFTVGCCGNFSIDRIGVDGEGLQTIFSGGLRIFQDWSPDGKQMLFTLNGSLWVAGSTGTRARPLGGDVPGAGGFAGARYSPDGSHLVAALTPAVGGEGDHQVIVLLHPDGQYLTVLTSGLPYNASDPSWSPDGKSIAFLADSGPFGILGRLHDVWIMHFSGANPRNVTNGRAGDVVAVGWAR